MRLEVKIEFRGNSGVKKNPRNTVLALRADQTYLFASETKRSSASLTCRFNRKLSDVQYNPIVRNFTAALTTVVLESEVLL